jgi:hypothetical protein
MWSWRYSSMVEQLLSIYEALGLISGTNFTSLKQPNNSHPYKLLYISVGIIFFCFVVFCCLVMLPFVYLPTCDWSNSGLVFFWNKVLFCSLGWPEIQYIAQTGLEFLILLPQPLEWSDYRHTAPCLAGCAVDIVFKNSLHRLGSWRFFLLAVLQFELRTSCFLIKFI